jgi:tRNA/rRNA methyltransferase
MLASQSSVRIVLVRPRNPLNLLAAARAAGNFGFDDVVVVSPHEPVWEEARASRTAGQWLRQARRAASLAEAVADRNWVLGTSCLARRRLSPERVILLDQLTERAARAKGRDRIAMVFGSEKRGLSNQDLGLCHAVIHIPTVPSTPSMNLGQAVALCCYELRRGGALSPAREAPCHTTATAAEISRLLDALERTLPNLGTGAGRPSAGARSRQAQLRQRLLRLPLTGQDVSLALGVLRKLSWRLRQIP